MARVTAFSGRSAPDTAGERETRVALAACYRLIAHFGMDDLVYTHISARVPGRPDNYLINPFGLMFHEITASSLVEVDHEGKIVRDTGYPVNEAGVVIHARCMRGVRTSIAWCTSTAAPASPSPVSRRGCSPSTRRR
jgi:ribulose-5-phosphate 4-epimerase/fuculose-1-phosphate aldolase